MSIKKTLCAVIIASSTFGLIGSGCKSTPATINKQLMRGGGLELDVSSTFGFMDSGRAPANIKSQLQETASNELLLRRRGLDVDVSDYIADAEKILYHCKRGRDCGKMEYGELSYYLNQALQEQRAALGK
jgi:hypothetical protein